MPCFQYRLQVSVEIPQFVSNEKMVDYHAVFMMLKVCLAFSSLVPSFDVIILLPPPPPPTAPPPPFGCYPAAEVYELSTFFISFSVLCA